MRLWKTFTECFNCLPVAALIDEKVRMLRNDSNRRSCVLTCQWACPWCEPGRRQDYPGDLHGHLRCSCTACGMLGQGLCSVLCPACPTPLAGCLSNAAHVWDWGSHRPLVRTADVRLFREQSLALSNSHVVELSSPLACTADPVHARRLVAGAQRPGPDQAGVPANRCARLGPPVRPALVRPRQGHPGELWQPQKLLLPEH